MARQSSEFVLAWSSLSCNEELAGWQVISLSPSGPIEIQAGRRSPDNSEAVLLCFPTAKLPRSEKLPEGKGFIVEKVESYGLDSLRVALTRQISGNLELFSTMVYDVVGALDEAAISGEPETKLLRTFIGRVTAWQQFMSQGAGSLSPEAELGLAGEIHFIKTFCELGVPPGTLLNSWVGPDDAPQDFLFGDGAIEVKATMSSSGFPVKIGSLEQLDDALRSPLFLAAVKFTNTNSGLSLPEMIAKLEFLLKGDPGAIQSLRERLLIAGYSERHAHLYNRKFEPVEEIILSVTEKFPRLTTGSVPAGITRTIYEINLDHSRQFCIDLNVVLNKLGVIG